MIKLRHRKGCDCNDCHINKSIFLGLLSMLALLVFLVLFNFKGEGYCTGFTMIDSLTVVSCQGDTAKLNSKISNHD